MGRFLVVLGVLALLVGGFYVLTQEKPDVVVYCALDSFHAQPIITEFEKKTGLHVKAQFDVEAVKTVGLVNSLMEEKSNPRCDVFWNNELVNTIRLEQAGVLEPYKNCPTAKDIPKKWKDPNGYWYGFAARARVIILNTKVAKWIEPDESKWPKSTADFLDPKWKGHITVAMPQAGTTLTHMAVLWAMKGKSFVAKFWEGLYANGVTVADGNSAVMKLVADYRPVPPGSSEKSYAFGFVDTDDFRKAQIDGYPVRRIFPDQQKGGMVTGCLVVPNAISLVKNCPHPKNGRRFIDFVLQRKVEQQLAFGESAQMPVRKSVPRPSYVKSAADLLTMKVDWTKAADSVKPFVDWFEEHQK